MLVIGGGRIVHCAGNEWKWDGMGWEEKTRQDIMTLIPPRKTFIGGLDTYCSTSHLHWTL